MASPSLDDELARAAARLDVRDFDDAMRISSRILKKHPKHAKALSVRGAALSGLRRFDEALAAFNMSLAVRPHFAVHLMRGNVLEDLRRPAEALASYDRAIALEPQVADGHSARARLLSELGRSAEALESVDRALALAPDDASAALLRGNVLLSLQRAKEALESVDLAIALQPDLLEGHVTRGSALEALRRLDEAIASYDMALALQPQCTTARMLKAFCFLLTGDYERGWVDYEARWLADETLPHSPLRKIKPAYPQPAWRGEDIAGQTILLHAEQGLGDTLQFCRYASLVAALGARVWLKVPRALKTLLQTLDGVERLFVDDEEIPPFQHHCPLMSLPLALKTTPSSIPATVPYLHIDPERASRWQDTLGPKRRSLRVGLTWSGNPAFIADRQRSMALRQLAPLLAIDAEFFALQRELRPADAEWLAKDGRVANVSDKLTDFAETAALLSQLDVVVSVDTAVAHLAGALGKRTCILVAFAPDWRWSLDRSDSAWYPSVRLFRQPRPGDWASVVRDLVVALG